MRANVFITVFPISYRLYYCTAIHECIQCRTSYAFRVLRIPRIRNTPAVLCLRISYEENFLVSVYIIYVLYTHGLYTYARSFLISIVSLNPSTRDAVKLRHRYF